MVKKVKYPVSKTLIVKIEDFSKGLDTETAENITDFYKSVNTYNFCFKSGALMAGMGFEELKIPSLSTENSAEKLPELPLNGTVRFVKVYPFRQYSNIEKMRIDKLVAVSNDKKFYFCRMVTPYPGFLQIDELQFIEVPKLINYNTGAKDVLLLTSENDLLNSWDALAATVRYADSPIVTNVCVYKNRTFITCGGENMFIRTEPLSNLLEWKYVPSVDNVNIYFDSERGSINKLLSFNGYMFAIRDFGISRVFWNETGCSYSITNLLCTGSKIYGQTACICGDKGIVLCKDGLYYFDSTSAKKISLKLNGMFDGISNQNAVACYSNGVYYLACKLKFNDTEKVGCETGDFVNNALISLDVATNTYSITRGVDIVDLCSAQFESMDKVLACFNSQFETKIGQLAKNGKMFSDATKKYWCSPLSDLGNSDKIKCVKEVSLISKFDATITVFSESESRKFNIKGTNVATRLPVRLNGKQIGISILCNSQEVYISNLKLTIELLDAEYV